MASTNIYKGDVTVKEQPGSGATELGGQITLRFKGKDDADFDATVTAAIPATHAVVSRRKTPGKGGLAECVVVLKPKTVSPGTGAEGADETLDCTYEIEMAQLEKPLLSHPSFSGYADHIDAWRNSPPEIRNANQYVTGTDENGEYETESLTSSELVVADKIRKGVESYLAFVPVVTKTTVNGATMPAVGANAGKRCAPKVKPQGTWEWLKTGDKAVQRQDNTWEHIEQWTAADEWDHDLYEAGQGE